MTTAIASPDRMTDDEFRGFFIENSEKPQPKDDAVSVLKQYISTRNQTIFKASELGIGDAGVQEIKTKAAKAFMKRWMLLKFAAVDLSFTDRKWWLKLERDTNGIKVVQTSHQPIELTGDPAFFTVAEINRFFDVKTDSQEFAFGKKISDRKGFQRSGHFSSTRKNGGMPRSDVTISALLPDGIGQKQMKKAQVAIGHAHFARAACYSHGIDLRADIGYNRWDRGTEQVRVIWGPNADVLSFTQTTPRPAGDPAIVIEMYDETYLLDFYDTPDELPISNLIREFSEGNLG